MPITPTPQSDYAKHNQTTPRQGSTHQRHVHDSHPILHKSSSFSPGETEGFQEAIDNQHIDQLELLWLPRDDSFRIFRTGEHPPLRGTMVSLDDTRHVLYTRGSVPLYKTYPGMYIPTPLPFRIARADSSPVDIASELLVLTKMNWNATQLDGRLPITLRTADAVGTILKRLAPDDTPQPRYAYYM